MKLFKDERTDRRFSRMQWRMLFATMIGYTLFYFMRKNFSFAMPGLQQDCGISKSMLGNFLFWGGIVYGLSKFVNGMVGDKVAPRKMLCFGLLACTLVNVAFGFAPQIAAWFGYDAAGAADAAMPLVWTFGLLLVLNQFFQGTGFPPCAKLIAFWIPPKELATKMSVWNTSHSVGGGLVAKICGVLVGLGVVGSANQGIGMWRWCFWSMAILGALGLLLMLFWANRLFSRNLIHDNYDSLAMFLVRGDWMRGANLFAFCSIMLVVGYAIMINVATRFLMGLTSGFLMRKGQTICRLVESFIRYISLIVVLYLTLNYLGLPVGTVVGSLGIASLALSLGAQNLAADILAGLFIVFERTFQVGDVVEINGKHGKVQEIGVRSTKLMLPGNNVLVLGNHCIEEVLNLTCKLSWCSVELRVPAQASLQKIEEALRRELPEISKRCDEIVGPLNYVGVTEIGGDIGTYMGVPTRTLTVSAECREEDKYSVRLFIIREMCLLFEREGIELM